MLRQVEARGDVNIFSYLKHIRAQRAHLVQTEEQYVFIHDALVEVIEAGETHINKTALPRYIHSLQCIDVTDEKNHPPKVLEKQHKVMDQICETFSSHCDDLQLGQISSSLKYECDERWQSMYH